MKFISIGSFTLKNPYFLAPMEEVNDIAFRLLCQKAGAGLVYTGMIHPQSHQEFSFDDKPALQLFCTTTKGIKEFIEKNDDNVVMWDFNFAKKIKDSVNIPVIYSGNIDENNAKEFLEIFDFIMIARNAIGNPNIFAKLTNNNVKITFNDYLDLAKKYNLPFRQIKFQAMNFTKGMDNAKELRLGIFKAKRVSEIREIFA